MLMRIICTLLLTIVPAVAGAQAADPMAAAIEINVQYQITSNITYLTANNWEAKLDVYRRRDATGPNRTLIFIHGGGWTGGSKEQSSLAFLPFLQMGWNVVNVEYRLARISLAPAAVEDCLCALRWVYRNAKQYNIDTNRLVITGGSAGSHLALTSGMIPPSAGLDRQCPGTEDLKVAAIINWYGITDVVDLLDGPNMKTYAVTWLGALPNREEIARRVSPLTYVRPGLAPVITIHGDADPTVPYAHGVRLRDALNKAGVPNRLVTVPGGRHGGFSQAEMMTIYSEIQKFLGEHIAPERSSR
jgi:acetyl esterase/lipase